MKPVLYMLIGAPCSGKSTYAKNDPVIRNYPIVSSDDLIDQIASILGMEYSYIFKNVIDLTNEACFNIAKNYVEEKRSFIIDRTNMSVKTRKKWLDLVGDDYSKVAVIFHQSLEVLQERNKNRSLMCGKKIPDQVFVDMLNNYEAPIKYEGFSTIVYR